MPIMFESDGDWPLAPSIDGLWLSPRRAAQPAWREVADMKGVKIFVDPDMPDDGGFLFKGGKMIAIFEFDAPAQNGHAILSPAADGE